MSEIGTTIQTLGQVTSGVQLATHGLLGDVIVL
jgi:hypothetical protein